MKTKYAFFGIFAISMALSAQLQAQSFLTNGLVAYYPFNGNAGDASGNGNDGEIMGNDWRFGFRFGSISAFYLNATDPPNDSVGTYVAAPRSPALDFNGDFTLSVWLYITNGLPPYHVHNLISDGPDSTSANFRLISAADGSNDFLQFVSDQPNGEGVDIHAYLPPLRNTWWQAVVVRSGSIVSLFQNGAVVTNWLMTAPLINDPEIWLGSMPSSTNETPRLGEYPLDGGMGDVRMYNRALSASEVQQLYAYEFPTATVTVIADPAEGGSVTGSGTFVAGSQVQISAAANNGWIFSGWSDGNVQNPRTITVPSSDVVYAAGFTTNTALVSLIAVPPSGGTVNGGGTLEVGSQAQISATPNDGWIFSGWSDGNVQNPRTITVPSNDVAYAVAFTPNTAVVTLIAVPFSGGTVNGGGTFEMGAQVQISATAYNGWKFSGWGDGNMENPRTITVPSSDVVYAASFTFVPLTASYSGLFYDTNGPAFQSSGFFNLTLTPKGTFSARILMAGEIFPFSGSFSAAGSASNSVLLSLSNRLTILTGFNSGGVDIVSGQLTTGHWTAELVANRTVYSKANLAPQAGKYTIVIPGSTNAAAQPGGDSSGAATVDPFGNLSFSGRLSDGSVVAQTAVVSGQGQWPFYVSLYAGKGLMLGWLTFTNEATNDIAGAPVWIKLRQPFTKYYPAGFTNQTEAVGSTFRFTNRVSVFNFAAGEISLAAGNLSQSFTNQFRIGDNNAVTSTNKTSLTISTSSGRFSGSVVNPATKQAIAIYGAVLQKQSTGAGYFLGQNESGVVLLGPVP